MLYPIHRLYLTLLSANTTRRAILSHVKSYTTQVTTVKNESQFIDKSSADIKCNPFTYTSGRWLKNDKLQRDARHIHFDFSALCQKAIQACPGACKIVRHEKREGSFNRVFLLQMDNDAWVVARVPFPVAGPRRLTTNSEVATMAYIRAHTTIPVPRILDWSDDPTNSIGTEYMIMECVSGIQLHGKWKVMNTLQQMLCIKSIAKLVKEMAQLQFPAYGSLYFADAPIDPSLKMDLLNGYCVGPHCATKYWCSEPGESRFYERRKANQGPWTDISSYCSGLIDTGYSRVPETTNTKKAGLNEKIQAHLRLLESSEQVIRELIKSSEIMNISAPMLLHPDLHKRNIFVSDEDPSLVTAVIDWQSAGIEPVFSFANETPDMVKDPLIDTPLLEDGSDTSPKQSSCHQENNSKEVISINEQTYEVAMRGWIPKLHDARALDEVLLRPIRYCHTSWRDGAAALRQELIELSQVWEKLGLPGSCPYQPTAVELDQHIKEWEDFQSLQTLKLFLIRSINSNTDGWVDPETWEAAKDANNAFLEEWLKTAAQSEDPNMNIERGRTLWPFDTNIV